HSAAHLVERTLLEEVALAPENADARRAEGFVTRRGEEVDAELRHVDRQVGKRLGCVEEHRDAVRMADATALFNRRTRPSNVRHVANRDELGLRGDQRFERLPTWNAVVVDRHGYGLAVHAPRDPVGVVFARGKDDLVFGTELEPVGDEIDRLGGPTNKDDLGW